MVPRSGLAEPRATVSTENFALASAANAKSAEGGTFLTGEQGIGGRSVEEAHYM